MKRIIEYENLAKVNLPFHEAYQKAFAAFLDKGWYVLGDQVSQFEQDFAHYIGVKHCIGVASGLDALHLSFEALSLPKGSEVIVAANAYIATVLGIYKAGLQPVLVEPSLNDANIDVSLIASKITKKTKAILPLHLYGAPCDMEAIMQLARDRGLYVVEDCAQAHGAEYDGKKVGSFGHLAAFSFYPTKNLGALGDAGAIMTDDDVLAEKLRALRNYGGQLKNQHHYVGFNSRLDALQAVFLSLKLKMLDKLNAHKAMLATLYDRMLHSEYKTLPVLPLAKSSHHIYPIFHSARDELRQYLAENGVHTQIHYPCPSYLQPAMAGVLSGEYPISDTLHATTLSLPISSCHHENDIRYVVNVLNGFIS